MLRNKMGENLTRLLILGDFINKDSQIIEITLSLLIIDII